VRASAEQQFSRGKKVRSDERADLQAAVLGQYHRRCFPSGNRAHARPHQPRRAPDTAFRPVIAPSVALFNVPAPNDLIP